ncbi:hypothetical protein AMJ80_02855 [bacterium SM23_31]|nr:MAG: hypothetical protein AMJ80_02855 [bacterium SM23_31]
MNKSAHFLISILLVTFCSPLYAQSIFDLITSKSNQNVILPDGKRLLLLVDGNYYDYFNFSNSSGQKHYLYNKNKNYHAHFFRNNYRISGFIRMPEQEYYVNNLENIDDSFLITSNYPEYEFNVKKRNSKYQIGIGILYSIRLGGNLQVIIPIKGYNIGLASSYKLKKYKFAYNVQGFYGEIPFLYYFNNNSLSFTGSQFSFQTTYSSIIPTHKKGDYNNKIRGYISTNKVIYTFKNVKNVFEYTHANIAANLNYKNEEYSYLDNVYYNHYIAYSQISMSEKFKLSIGVTGIKTRIKSESYFDIWPFTYWDVFLQSRTRLKKFNNSLHLPFIVMNYLYSLNKTKIKSDTSFELGYYHKFFTSDIIYKERYPVFYPIFFGYKTKTWDISPDIDGILRLKVDSSWQYKNYNLTILLSQLIPVDFSKLKYKRKAGQKVEVIAEKKRGGTNVWISIGYSFN